MTLSTDISQKSNTKNRLKASEIQGISAVLLQSVWEMLQVEKRIIIITHIFFFVTRKAQESSMVTLSMPTKMSSFSRKLGKKLPRIHNNSHAMLRILLAHYNGSLSVHLK